jgi:hypothetical protein
LQIGKEAVLTVGVLAAVLLKKDALILWALQWFPDLIEKSNEVRTMISAVEARK